MTHFATPRALPFALVSIARAVQHQRYDLTALLRRLRRKEETVALRSFHKRAFTLWNRDVTN